MSIQGKHFNFDQIGPLENLEQHNYHGVPGKRFIGNDLGLSGCEVSLNRLPAGKGMPFVHAHKKNEELYVVLRGSGLFYADGEEFTICEGSLFRIAPEGARAITAGTEDLYFICVQAEANSQLQGTMEDGYLVDVRASWMKN